MRQQDAFCQLQSLCLETGRKPCLRHCQGSSVVFRAGFLLWASAGSVAFRSSHSVGVYPDTKWICISFPILSSPATACFIPLRHLHGLWFDPVSVRMRALAVFHYRSSRPALSQGLSIHRCWDMWYELRFYQRVWKLLSCSCLQEHWLGMACSPHWVSNQQCTNIAQVANRKKQQHGSERLSMLALQRATSREVFGCHKKCLRRYNNPEGQKVSPTEHCRLWMKPHIATCSADIFLFLLSPRQLTRSKGRTAFVHRCAMLTA